VYFSAIELDKISIPQGATLFNQVSKFPEVERDLSMLIDPSVTYAQLEQIAYKTERKILKSVNLFDVYEGEKIASGKKSYALNFRLQDETQTLTEKQIDKVMDRIMQALEKEAGAQFRKS
jgi:phenylalanyl-tRNA synthetase beta chain